MSWPLAAPLRLPEKQDRLLPSSEAGGAGREGTGRRGRREEGSRSAQGQGLPWSWLFLSSFWTPFLIPVKGTGRKQGVGLGACDTRTRTLEAAARHELQGAPFTQTAAGAAPTPTHPVCHVVAALPPPAT